MRRAAALLLAFLILGGCTREEARARLQDDIQADTIDIIHARFPCRSPDLHFFGYRFRVILKGEFGDGDICWNMSTRQWSWRILPGQSLSRLNPRNYRPLSHRPRNRYSQFCATSMPEPSRVQTPSRLPERSKKCSRPCATGASYWPGGWRAERAASRLRIRQGV